MDGLNDMMMTRAPTARRPLLGLTVLVVEDSRFACEALRLLCLRSGARIRRADSLENARRHLSVYRPTVLMVDVGLPDGSGIALIETLAATSPRIDVILGMSGETTVEQAVMAAGADGFIAKPIGTLASFQSAILAHLPPDRQPPSPRELSNEVMSPDPVALQDDLNHVVQVLKTSQDNDVDSLDYITQFLGGVARSAKDREIGEAVRSLVTLRDKGGNLDQGIADLSRIVEKRLASGGTL